MEENNVQNEQNLEQKEEVQEDNKEPVNNPEDNDKVIPKLIQDEMKQAYVNYAMSVIVGRALPDVRDGLKPVHRRILYGMYDMGMLHNRPFKKCARIVGEVLGKYHPHGDGAVYDALVRMAQDFSLRYPLVKGQGNFGSIDGDNAAAMRYTEAKLNKIAEELLKDIDKDTIDFRDNFDGSLKEPSILPSKAPNLLINGSSGIAVGMATNIPPHNLGEVCTAVNAMIDNPEITVQELMQIVPGPDFPTGGELYVGGELLAGYTRGRGRVMIKSIVDIEGDKLIVREIPYMVNKSDLIIHIADLVKNKKIIGIRNINDESDREGIRVVIDLKRDVDPQIVLNQLYKHSRLKVSFSLNMLALVDNQPKLLGLRDFLHNHILHRKEVVTRRTQFDLKKAEERIHVLEGLMVAINNLDDVIPAIRNSRTVEDAKQHLMENYQLSEIQVKAILELRLQKLASLEREKIKTEHEDLLKLAESLQAILGSEERVYQIIKDETLEIKDKYADERRSKILIGDMTDVDMEDLIEESVQVVTMTNSGYLKRVPLDTYRTQHRGGKGMTATGMKDDDFVENVYVCSTHDYLLFFTDMGQVYWQKVYHIPEGSRYSKGKHVANLIGLKEGENISAVLAVRDFEDGYLFMATQKGVVKKTELKYFSKPRKGGIRAIGLANDDSLIGVKYTDGSNEIILVTKRGLANRFKESKVRSMGRTAFGVRGIRLNSGDKVVSLLVAEDDKQILTLTENGYGKRTNVNEYRLCNRGGKGVTNLKVTEKNGKVVTAKIVDGEEELMLITKKGVAIRVKSDSISIIGRVTQGVRVMRLNAADELAAAAKFISEDEDLSELENEEVIVEPEGSDDSAKCNVPTIEEKTESKQEEGPGSEEKEDNGEVFSEQNNSESDKEPEEKTDEEKLEPENSQENPGKEE
jgi:DNA gyrase subunit A